MQSYIRASQVFAATRQAALEASLHAIRSSLIPEFNAEVEDITREHAQIAKGNKALADNKKKARILALNHAKQQILNAEATKFNAEMEAAITKLEGAKFQCTEIPRGKDKEVTRTKVKFSDGSIAQWPKIFVPYREFAQI